MFPETPVATVDQRHSDVLDGMMQADVGRRVEPPALDEQHAQAGSAELLGDRPPRGPATDETHVGLDEPIGIERSKIVNQNDNLQQLAPGERGAACLRDGARTLSGAGLAEWRRLGRSAARELDERREATLA